MKVLIVYWEDVEKNTSAFARILFHEWKSNDHIIHKRDLATLVSDKYNVSARWNAHDYAFEIWTTEQNLTWLALQYDY